MRTDSRPPAETLRLLESSTSQFARDYYRRLTDAERTALIAYVAHDIICSRDVARAYLVENYGWRLA